MGTGEVFPSSGAYGAGGGGGVPDLHHLMVDTLGMLGNVKCCCMA